MGTDIVLSWKGRPSEEEIAKAYSQEPKTGGVGRLGYLRVAISSVAENSFLKALFGERIFGTFQHRSEQMEYNFRANQSKDTELIQRYRNSPDQFADAEVVKRANMVASLTGPGSLGGISQDTASSAGKSLAEVRQQFIENVKAFLALGLRLQDKGLRPIVKISW